jgi:hypothetical protein
LRQQLERLDRLPLQVEKTRFDVRRARLGLGNTLHAGDQERPAV